jgi:uncharacterized protein YfdQ (DUF2303 family)
MQGVCFKPPTPPIVSHEGKFSNYKVELSSIMSSPFVWDMEDMYGTSKRPFRFLGAVDTIKLDDFIRELNTGCDVQHL